MPSATLLPRVTVLLATFNGARWLPEQLASILDQQGVDVRVIVSDDGSTDGTRDFLDQQAAQDDRLTLLDNPTPSGGSAANFYRLVTEADIPADGYVAFADQDDIWMQGKLERHARILEHRGVDGVSSSVTSFSASGRRSLVRKDFPQQAFDYLLESPGPGSTFLLSARLARFTADTLSDVAVAREVEFHDSLIYAIARAHGWGWHIDGEPTVDYRQHDSNVMGSNTGFSAALERFRLIRSHWLRNHAVLLTRVALHVSPESTRPELERILALVTGRGIRNSLALARMVGHMRRRPRDQRIIAVLVAIGVW